MTIIHRSTISILCAMMLLALMPLVASAQSKSDLETAIWASVLQDPRAADVPPDQMQILVSMLVSEAEAQDLAASDISWRPAGSAPVAEAAAPEEACGFLCMMNDAFGFSSDDLLIPGLLFASSGLLLVVIRRMRMMHRAQAVAGTTPPWTPGSSPAAPSTNPFDSYL